MTRLVIFDLDGTLYDNGRLPLYVVLHSLCSLRMLKAERSVRTELSGIYFGQGSATTDELLSRVSERTGKPLQAVTRWYFEDYLPLQEKMLRAHFHAKPWVFDTLARLKADGVMIACFSDYPQISGKLEALGIDPSMFDILADAPSMGGCKPCPEAFLNLVAKAGVSPAEALVVGDRDDNDGEGARRSGLRCQIIPRHDTDSITLEL